MCGICGIVSNEQHPLLPTSVRTIFHDLFLLSESRGKEASGIITLSNQRIHILKGALPASRMVHTHEYADVLQEALAPHVNSAATPSPLILMGHSRLATTGSQHDDFNNQPVNAGNAVGIHNGIIVNHEQLWAQYPALTRKYQVDTEVIFSLTHMFYQECGSLRYALRQTFEHLNGTASIALLFADLAPLALATNNGSLYYCVNAECSAFLFASERHILDTVIGRTEVRKALGACEIRHIQAGEGYLIYPRGLRLEPISLTKGDESFSCESPLPITRTIIETIKKAETLTPVTSIQKQVGLSQNSDQQTAEYLNGIKRRFPHDSSWQDSLRRCTRCILPETMPFIEFDEHGVCNYCRGYNTLIFHGAEELARLLEPHRRQSGEPDCVVGVSGGRDSLYSLHYLKTVLHMNPVAYTYDWGMVTDLARRNISRVCARLGIEHILVSADINKKRRFIKKNVAAWLKKPDIGLVPLFMAGDKQYFYYHYQVRKQLGVNLAIQGENRLERTDFKTGFANVRPYYMDSRHYNTLPPWSIFKLAYYYGKGYFSNPRYLNASVFDTLWAYASFYVIDRRYINVYNYIPWIEDDIVATLVNEYEFELATDTVATWRIGDGTAAFYNYIYYTIAGFTENDTFRSNQIREGLIARDLALEKVREENKPRYESLYWYLNIINLNIDMADVLEIIHRAPKIRPKTIPHQ